MAEIRIRRSYGNFGMPKKQSNQGHILQAKVTNKVSFETLMIKMDQILIKLHDLCEKITKNASSTLVFQHE